MTWHTLTFMGFSRGEIIGVGALGAGLSLAAWLSGTLLGLLLGWLLVAVINAILWLDLGLAFAVWQCLLFGWGLILVGLACGLMAALRVSKRLEI